MRDNLNFSNEELIEIISNSKSLSSAARKVFGDDKYSNRERIKELSKNLNIEQPKYYGRKRYCLFCGKEILGPDRLSKVFCNRSCSASYNNARRAGNGLNKICLNCGKELKHTGKYCCKECENEFNYKESVRKWKNGEICGSDVSGSPKTFLKKYLLNKHNEKCQVCGCDLKNPYTGLSILQIHHIDGNCMNTDESNLQLLCPNCHAMTDNFGRKNPHSARVNRYKNIRAVV